MVNVLVQHPPSMQPLRAIALAGVQNHHFGCADIHLRAVLSLHKRSIWLAWDPCEVELDDRRAVAALGYQAGFKFTE